MKKRHSFRVGQRIWWDDPDNGYSSGYYFIFEITGDTALIYNDFSEAEVYLHELRST